MLSLLSKGRALRRGPLIAASFKPGRGTASLPRLAQAAVAEKFIPETLPYAPPPAASSFGISPLAGSGKEEFWRKVPIWENVSAADFLSYRWSVRILDLFLSTHQLLYQPLAQLCSTLGSLSH